MTTVELRKTVLQEVASLMDDDESMQQLLDFLLSLKGDGRQAYVCELPYTRKERRHCLLQSEADVMAGKVCAHEEVVARIREKIAAWK